MPPSYTWQACVRTEPATAEMIAAAGERAFGDLEVAVIPAYTRSDMTAPEIGFNVEAPDEQTAKLAARQAYLELRQRAGLDAPSEPVRVMDLWPLPRPRRTAA